MRLGGAPPAARAASGGGLRLRSAAPGLPALARSLQLRQAGRQLALDVQARDGKKRRKPQQRGSMDSSSSDDEAAARPAPRRVVTDSLIPVRLQQKFAKLNKEYERRQGEAFRQKAAVPSAFRRDSLDSEEYRRQKDEQERLQAEERRYKSDQATLQQMFRTNISAAGEQPLCVTLIDGYNLLHKWRLKPGPLRDLMDRTDAYGTFGLPQLELARDEMLRQLDVHSHAEGLYIHIVFDAMGSGYSSQHNTLGMIVNFTGNEEADSFIMRQAKDYHARGVQKVCVVSDDAELRLGATVSTDPGQAVFTCSCESLIRLVDDSQSLFEKRLHASNLKAQAARAISGSLGAVAKTRSGGRAAGGLAGLRQALAQQEDAAAEQEARRRREQQRQQQEERRRQQQEALQQEQQQQQAEAEQQPGEPP